MEDKSNVPRNLASRIGCHSWGIYPAALAAIPTFADVGCRWVRLTRPMQIDICAKGPGQGYDFASHGEAAVDAILAKGMSIMGILDLRCWPEGIDSKVNPIPWASPIWEHLDIWSDFVTQCVRFYRGRVKYWEVINEPPFFWWYPTSSDPNATEPDNKQTRRGSVRHYVELLKCTAAAVRTADPEAKIISGASFTDGRFLASLYQYGAKGTFDIVGVHYFPCSHPDTFAKAVGNVRRVMEANGDGDLPIWDTENGPGGAVIGYGISTPADYEGCVHFYRHCLFTRHGIERYFWFNPVDEGADAPLQSLLHLADGSLGPSYKAMKTLAERVGDAPLRSSRTFGGEGHVFVFDTPRGAVTVAWGTAPCKLHLAKRYAGVLFNGAPLFADDGAALDGRPIVIDGDLLADGAEIEVVGRRTTITQPMKQPPADAPKVRSTPVASDATLDTVDWTKVPVVASHDDIPIVPPHPHFCVLPSSVTGDLQIAHNGDALFLRFHAIDAARDPVHPTGAIQFTIRDSDPDVAEWPYFFNGYGLFGLWASPDGARFLRNDPMDCEKYPGGIVREAEVRASPVADGIDYVARIPWSAIGPCRPGKNNPFLFFLNCNRGDNMLDVPVEEHPEEWSHNWGDSFIAKDPAWVAWIEFR